MLTKEEIIDSCLASVTRRINEVEFAIKDADQALADDTKSSAGDKYETSREMVQQDITRYQKQLAIANTDRDVLQKIDPLKSNERIGLGSVVRTDAGLYFISISIGLLKIQSQNIYVISPLSPIGQELIGKSKGDEIHFNGKTQKVISVS
ncbi:GreA/GreB family elongation factor [Sphingobacterium rhinopitheci]|uniref:GreA/GreB family elongation factor n=1 Tax=Sphingobacterium rhinopitheci TaxID=2781960 RepID=UPI001F51945F|nr:GreA/GreB family elongation factor [Sphingobacterium rhinopitheci]MCI0921955.1 GreA/GreB family elongation factor [Sphingobacterium rhinopitheci]